VTAPYDRVVPAGLPEEQAFREMGVLMFEGCPFVAKKLFYLSHGALLIVYLSRP